MIKLQIVTDPNGNISSVRKEAVKKSGFKEQDVKYFKVFKRSVDARKGDVKLIWSIGIDNAAVEEKSLFIPSCVLPSERIAIIGAGPSGLFCGLVLARAGLKPLVIERGGDVDKRRKDVDGFIKTRRLNVNSNVQFGEGGAGTFSDGKLNTGIKTEYKDFILNEFVRHGADENILYEAKPHIGSDKLPSTVKNIREEIKSFGGEFLFDSEVIGLKVKGDKISALKVIDVNGQKIIPVSEVVLAIGHSSRNTFEMLVNSGVAAERKDMAIGLRIEHLQEDINKTQFGRYYNHPNLGAADYKLTSNAGGRGVFTFCMCPGGFVMPATSEEGAVVTNGMSLFSRAGRNANSAVVVQVSSFDYGEGDVLKGIDYQREIEKKAFILGGEDYSAPISLLDDFMRGKTSSSFKDVLPTYPLGARFADLNKLLPEYVSASLKIGITDMGRRLKGFSSPSAILTGAETRTSSPVRILRDENMQSPTFINLYPVGEVGYAGGIMSAAVDGIKLAFKLIEKYSR